VHRCLHNVWIHSWMQDGAFSCALAPHDTLSLLDVIMCGAVEMHCYHVVLVMLLRTNFCAVS
jgi:hypothetical protein